MPRAKASLVIILTTALTVAVLFWLPYTPAHIVHTVTAEKGEWVKTALLSGVVGYEQQQHCVAAWSGKISKVYASPGQKVKKGDVLFLMDTSVQEQMLYAMQNTRYTQMSRLGALEQETAILAAQQLQWNEKEMELKRSIELAQIRARMDGTVASVYVNEGSYVEEAGSLGSIHNDQLCVDASGRTEVVGKTAPGTSAVLEKEGKEMGIAQVLSLSAPEMTMEGMQRLKLLPLAQKQLAECEAGDRVTVELLIERIGDQVMIPLAAVDADSKVWYVENGAAYAQVVDTTRRNGNSVAVTPEWEGRKIILLPQGLYEGCPVKEAKT